MSQPTTESVDTDDPEAIFRRDVTRIFDEIWKLGVVDDAIAALYPVINKGRREVTSEAERGHQPG